MSSIEVNDLARSCGCGRLVMTTDGRKLAKCFKMPYLALINARHLGVLHLNYLNRSNPCGGMSVWQDFIMNKTSSCFCFYGFCYSSFSGILDSEVSSLFLFFFAFFLLLINLTHWKLLSSSSVSCVSSFPAWAAEITCRITLRFSSEYGKSKPYSLIFFWMHDSWYELA